MADNTEKWRLLIEGEAKDLEAQLERLPGIGEEAAKKMSEAIQGELNDAAEGAGDAFDEMADRAEDAAKGVDKATKSAGKSLDKMGGTAGKTASATGKLKSAVSSLSPELAEALDMVQKGADAFEGTTQITEVLDEAMGGAGLAGSIGEVMAVAAPAAVIVAALGTATAIVANTVHEARDEMAQYRAEMENTNASAQSLIRSQNALNVASGDVAGFVSQLKLQAALLNGEISNVDMTVGMLGNALVDELEPQLRSAGMAVGENITRIQELERAIGTGSLAVDELSASYLALDRARAAQGPLEEQLQAIKDLSLEGRVAISEYGTVLDQQATSSTKATKATRGHSASLKENKAAAAEAARAQAELAKMTEHYANLVSKARFGDAWTGLQTALGGVDQAVQMGALVEQDAILLRTKAWDEYNAHLESNEAKRAAQLEAHHKDQLNRIAAEEQRHLDAVQAQMTVTAMGVNALSQISDAAFSNRMKGMDQESKAYKRHARKQFEVNKALQVANAGVNLGQAMMMTMATLGPPVPPNVAGIAGMAFTVAAGAAQIGAIAAQEPPTFHVGGQIGRSTPGQGEVDIRAREGEHIFTRGQVENAGGSDAMSDLAAGPLARTIVLQNQLRHRTLDAVTHEVLGAGGKTSRMTRSLRPDLGKNPYLRS